MRLSLKTFLLNARDARCLEFEEFKAYNTLTSDETLSTLEGSKISN